MGAVESKIGLGMKKRILVIEDDELILEGIRLLLESKYDIFPFLDARSALTEAPFDDVDLILLDHFMPEMDGPDFLRELSTKKLRTPVIVMSANGRIDSAFRDLKVSGFLRKPFKIEEVESEIERVLVH
jgi:two-component system, OmpR family, response regulator